MVSIFRIQEEYFCQVLKCKNATSNAGLSLYTNFEFKMNEWFIFYLHGYNVAIKLILLMKFGLLKISGKKVNCYIFICDQKKMLNSWWIL